MCVCVLPSNLVYETSGIRVIKFERCHSIMFTFGRMPIGKIWVHVHLCSSGPHCTILAND